MRVYLVVGIVCGSLVGCSERHDPPVEKSVMVELLIELHLAQASARLDPEGEGVSSDSILKHYDVSRQDLQSTLDYYASEPDEYVALMDTVIERMRVLRPDLANDLEASAQQGRYPHFGLGDTTAAPRSVPQHDDGT